jgi:hypothetical protein
MAGLPATWRWRLTEAWKALTATTMPDPDAFYKWRAERQRNFAWALNKLEPASRSLLLGVTPPLGSMADHIMPVVEEQAIEDQLVLMKYLTGIDGHFITAPAAKRWAEKHSRLMASL